MTYLQFHLVFTVPPLVALALLQGRTRGPWWPLLLLVGIAFAWTTPWDNYLVAREVWSYPPGRVLATVGYVPVEEYAFFVIQTVMTGLWVRLLQARWSRAASPPGTVRARVVGAVLFGALAVVGAVLWARGGHGLYLGLIVVWAAPVLALMWAVGGHLLVARRRLLVWAVVPPTLYLWAADWYAITQAGIWTITDATRTGWELAGLPVEEALFFLVTNVMVAQGLVMLEPDAMPETVGRLRRAGRAAA
jgi:lycopene cyclase domain-containing protein